MIIAGFDISSSTIGICVLEDNKLMLLDYVKPKGNTFVEKVISAYNETQELLSQFKQLDVIITEQPNIRFKTGFSSAQVISTILRFNGAFLFSLYQKYSIIPIEIAATSARKLVIGKGRFAKGTNTKEEVFKWVKMQLPNQVWPLNKKGNLKEECYDMADAVIIAKSYEKL